MKDVQLPNADSPGSADPSRRRFLQRSALGIAGLIGSTAIARAATEPDLPPAKPFPSHYSLARIHASPDRIIKETVGLRPFRESGPNLSVEKLGQKTIVHHYGHGGSGWSLSWGTGEEAVGKALQTGERHYAVLGCGVIGMTTATLLQRAGKQVRIYTKDRQPHVTSSMATGVWSPDSRICLEEYATPSFAKWWGETAARSFRAYQDRVGLANRPVEWVDSFAVSNTPWDERREEYENRPGPKFGHFGEEIRELVPGSWDVEPGTHPFAERYVRQGSRMIYNIPVYTQMIMDEFFRHGGRLEIQDFQSLEQIRSLPERTIVNCTGLGSQKLFGDQELVPVRGQLTFLVPQPEVRYQLSCEGGYIIPRQDGIVVGASENGRYGSTDLAPDRQQSLDAIAAIARTMDGLRT